MPLYEYECQQCKRHTEKIQKFSDTEITVCPHCGGALKRVITAPAIAFKGGGWYKDGYGNAKPAAASSSGESAGGSGGASSGDSGGSSASSGDSAAAPAPAATPAAPPAAAATAAPSSAPKT